MKATVWYFRPELALPALTGSLKATKAGIDGTHIKLIELEIEAPSVPRAMHKIFSYMQAENWSPNGEARPLIESKELSHTSMSVGDVIEIDGEMWMVEMLGFKRVL